MVTIKGGDRWEAHLKEYASKLGRPVTLSVGWQDGAAYPDGTPVAAVVAGNEYGRPSAGQPPRPAIRNMVAARSPEWGPKFAALLKANGGDATHALEQMGEAIKGEMQQAIADYSGPALKPSTVARKGSAKPLVDTGQELASITVKME